MPAQVRTDPPAQTADTRPALPPSNVPQPMTRFIGRAREMAEVRQQLASERLVTLVGPGGIGKTRLALEAAREALEATRVGSGSWI